jgi:cation/acetate symporter
MLTGFFVCLIYLVQTNPALGGSSAQQWFHIAPASAGVFGVPAGLLVMIIVSLLTPPPKAEVIALVDQLRSP